MDITYIISAHIHTEAGCKGEEAERRSVIDVNAILYVFVLRKIIEQVTCSGNAFAGIKGEIISYEAI